MHTIHYDYEENARNANFIKRILKMCCPESWISIQTNGTIVVQQNNPMTNINNNRNKTNWIILCEEWKYIRLYIYHIHIPYVISRARHRYTDLMIGRAQLVVHWQRVLNAYIKWPQITTTTTTKWWKNKTKKQEWTPVLLKIYNCYL